MAVKCVTAPKRIVSRIITQGGMGWRRELISSGFKAALPREKGKSSDFGFEDRHRVCGGELINDQIVSAEARGGRELPSHMAP